MQEAVAEAHRKKYTIALKKGDKKEMVRVRKAIAKGAPAKEQEAQVTKHKHIKSDDPAYPKYMEDYRNRDRSDPKDSWYSSQDGTFWNGKRWVDHPVTHLDKLLGPKTKAPAQTVPVVHNAREVAKPPEHIMHLHPDERMEHSETSYAAKHPDYVPVARLSWDEHAIARMEGRPITSHAGVEKPPHEADVPQTGIKVI